MATSCRILLKFWPILPVLKYIYVHQFDADDNRDTPSTQFFFQNGNFFFLILIRKWQEIGIMIYCFLFFLFFHNNEIVLLLLLKKIAVKFTYVLIPQKLN